MSQRITLSSLPPNYQAAVEQFSVWTQMSIPQISLFLLEQGMIENVNPAALVYLVGTPDGLESALLKAVKANFLDLGDSVAPDGRTVVAAR